MTVTEPLKTRRWRGPWSGRGAPLRMRRPQRGVVAQLVAHSQEMDKERSPAQVRRTEGSFRFLSWAFSRAAVTNNMHNLQILKILIEIHTENMC